MPPAARARATPASSRTPEEGIETWALQSRLRCFRLGQEHVAKSRRGGATAVRESAKFVDPSLKLIWAAALEPTCPSRGITLLYFGAKKLSQSKEPQVPHQHLSAATTDAETVRRGCGQVRSARHEGLGGIGSSRQTGQRGVTRSLLKEYCYHVGGAEHLNATEFHNENPSRR